MQGCKDASHGVAANPRPAQQHDQIARRGEHRDAWFNREGKVRRDAFFHSVTLACMPGLHV
jgi:hypothetical protein